MQRHKSNQSKCQICGKSVLTAKQKQGTNHDPFSNGLEERKENGPSLVVLRSHISTALFSCSSKHLPDYCDESREASKEEEGDILHGRQVMVVCSNMSDKRVMLVTFNHSASTGPGTNFS